MKGSGGRQQRPGKVADSFRAKLAGAVGERLPFTGRVARLGRTKKRTRHTRLPTVLLRDVQCKSHPEFRTDHVWLKVGKQLQGVSVGSVVNFTARVRWYRKAAGFDLQLSYHRLQNSA